MNSLAKLALVANIAVAKVAPDGYVLVPGGYMHQSCVHEVAMDTVLDTTTLAECPHPFIRSVRPANRVNASHGAAWKAWAQYAPSPTSSLTSLISQWTVPSVPIAPGSQTLFWCVD